MTRYFSMRLIKTFTLFFAFLLGMTQTAWGQSGNWTDYKATGYESGSGTAADPYIIKTAEQLAYFSARVTSGNDKSVYVKLGANIDLSEHFWVPIGNTTSTNGNNFSGTFDGDGYYINNMTVQWEAASSGKKCFGFFSQLMSGANVRNIIFDHALLYNVETTSNPNAGEDRLLG